MPADGSEYPRPAPETRAIHRTRAILPGGGRALLLFEGAATPPPPAGQLTSGGDEQDWACVTWCVETAFGPDWRGFALLDRLPMDGADLRGAPDGEVWTLPRPAGIDVGPATLAGLVREGGADGPAVLDLLTRELRRAGEADPAALRALRDFVAGFLKLAAERDGFIEIIAHPGGGGTFVQGWAMSLTAGTTPLVGLGAEMTTRAVEVASFAREDILPPGQGFCLFDKGWPVTEPADVDALYFAASGRLWRLDVVTGTVPRLSDSAALTHIGEMQARLDAPEATLRAFRRIRRSRFEGADTLTSTALPVAAAFDAVLRGPEGDLLVVGWLLDPLARVKLALIKSTTNLYCRINASWCRLPRPDLNQAFDGDPRFAGLLDPSGAQHGFIVRIPATKAQVCDTQLYLELVLDDETCLFRPLTALPVLDVGPVTRLLSHLSPREPELDRIVAEHAAPFLGVFSRQRRSAPRDRPIPLGTGAPDPDQTAALIPFRDFAELQPMLAMLAGTPEARSLRLTLTASRAVAAEALPRLAPAFAFYGLTGELVLCGETDTIASRLDQAADATATRQVLCWLPSALPCADGWFETLRAEAEAMPRRGLISPAMIYEDGSIYFGGARPNADGGCGWAGYGADRLRGGATRAAVAGAAEIALVDRDILIAAGGFAGTLFGDAFAHLDLAERLRARGHACHCSGTVTFWKLDDHRPAPETPLARLLRKVDAALLAARAPLPQEDPR